MKIFEAVLPKKFSNILYVILKQEKIVLKNMKAKNCEANKIKIYNIDKSVGFVYF